MKRFVAAAVLAAFAIAGSGCTTPNATQAPPPTSVSAQPANPQRPWERAQAVVQATNADASKGGIQAIRSHVAALEEILANADQAFSFASASTNPVYVLTDGQAETLAALLLATKGSGAPGAQVCRHREPVSARELFSRHLLQRDR